MPRERERFHGNDRSELTRLRPVLLDQSLTRELRSGDRIPDQPSVVRAK
jgi:hypothetical protein